MVALALPVTGYVYLDTNCFIYSVERIDPYRAVLDILWQTVSIMDGELLVVTSELTLHEVLVKPLKMQDATTATIFRIILRHSPDVRMSPISQAVLEESARLRATTGLKTPDAIHAATALLDNCKLFLTNDPAFRRVPGLEVTVLSEAVE